MPSRATPIPRKNPVNARNRHAEALTEKEGEDPPPSEGPGEPVSFLLIFMDLFE